jgi:hypothetical protein
VKANSAGRSALPMVRSAKTAEALSLKAQLNHF